jgi:hypothetical protein
VSWKDEDEVTTTFGTLKQAQLESYEYAIEMVEEVIHEMIVGGFDYTTLEELRQRIR